MGSDHQLLMSKIKLKLNMRNKKSDNVRERTFESNRVKDPNKKREFCKKKEMCPLPP